MDILKRELAPIHPTAWKMIDDQVHKCLKSKLSARCFTDVKGPMGLKYTSHSAGVLGCLSHKETVSYGIHQVHPLIEMRVPFSLKLWDLDNILRGSVDLDLTAAEEAANSAAKFEEHTIYKGLQEAGVAGLACKASDSVVTLSGCTAAVQTTVAQAVRKMSTCNAVEGPYLLVGGDALQKEMDKMLGNHTLRRALQKSCGIADVLYSPYYEGAFLVSARGGDFDLVIGQDYAVGYQGTEGGDVKLFITQSFTFVVHEPRACFPILIA